MPSTSRNDRRRVLLEVIRGDRIPITNAMTDPERRREVELRTALTSANGELLFAAQAAPRDEARVTTLQQWRVDSASSTALMLAFHRE